MMRSLFSGVSGLRVHQTKMDVIGNNIANVNTVGYKASRVTFNEVFSQTIGGASAANSETGRGGVNPRQIGLGVGVASIDKLMTIGAAQRTDNPFDLMIQGEGFFIVGDGSGQYFTRAGALNLDAAGNLVTSSGLSVMGWNEVDKDGNTIKGIVTPISITGEKEFITPKVTTQIDFSGNLNAANNTDTPKVTSMTFYDSVGNSYVVDVEMQYTKVYETGKSPADAAKDSTIVPVVKYEGWEFRVRPVAYPNGERSKGMEIEVGADGSIEFTGLNAPSITPAATTVGFLVFGTNGLPQAFVPEGGSANIVNGEVLTVTYPDYGTTSTNPLSKAVIDSNFTQFVISVKPGADVAAGTGTPPTPAHTENYLTPSSVFGDDIPVETSTTPLTVKNGIILDFSSLTEFGKLTSNATSTPKNGNAAGTLTGLSIGTDGTIYGRYSNGQQKALAQIPVAVFKNPAGLEKVGDNLFVPTANSGDFDGVGQDATTGGGSILGGVLEMSNVDLSQEFTEMITTQRGFQASSRVITTSDDMLQELVNLKR